MCIILSESGKSCKAYTLHEQQRGSLKKPKKQLAGGGGGGGNNNGSNEAAVEEMVVSTGRRRASIDSIIPPTITLRLEGTSDDKLLLDPTKNHLLQSSRRGLSTTITTTKPREGGGGGGGGRKGKQGRPSSAPTITATKKILINRKNNNNNIIINNKSVHSGSQQKKVRFAVGRITSAVQDLATKNNNTQDSKMMYEHESERKKRRAVKFKDLADAAAASEKEKARKAAGGGSDNKNVAKFARAIAVSKFKNISSAKKVLDAKKNLPQPSPSIVITDGSTIPEEDENEGEEGEEGGEGSEKKKEVVKFSKEEIVNVISGKKLTGAARFKNMASKSSPYSQKALAPKLSPFEKMLKNVSEPMAGYGRRIYEKDEIFDHDGKLKNAKELLSSRYKTRTSRATLDQVRRLPQNFGIWDRIYDPNVISTLPPVRRDHLAAMSAKATANAIQEAAIPNAADEDPDLLGVVSKIDDVMLSPEDDQYKKDFQEVIITASMLTASSKRITPGKFLLDDDFKWCVENTRFSEREILKWFKNFRLECPQGHLTKNHLCRLCRKILPCGNGDSFVHHVFRIFDNDNNGHLDFKVICFIFSQDNNVYVGFSKWS